MATLDDSPSLFAGKSWLYWADKVGETPPEKAALTPADRPGKDDSMKLKKEDMKLYGLCPAQDEFYLVVCECCGQVVKPQALKTHMEQRHSGIGDPSIPSSRSPVKSYSRTAPPSKSHSIPQKPDRPGRPPPGVHMTSLRTPGSHPRSRSTSPTGQDTAASRLLHEPERKPPILDKHDNKNKIHSKSFDEAVVKVERIELAPKKIAPSCISGGISGLNSINFSTSNRTEVAVVNSELTHAGSKSPADQGKKLTPKVTSFAARPICIKSDSHPLSVQKDTAGWKPIGPATETIIPRRLSDTTNKQERHEGKQDKRDKKPVLSLAVSSAPVSVVTTTTTTVATAVTTCVTSLAKNATVAVSGGNSSTPQTTVSEQIAAIKKFEKDRLKPCKDREFNPDKHCGVWMPEIGKACTRSLTCKSHALSLRRAVKGRRLPFDELLHEHKEAKKIYFAAKAKDAAGLPLPTQKKSSPSSTLNSAQPSTVTSALANAGQALAVLTSQPMMVKSPSTMGPHSVGKNSKIAVKPQLSPRSPAAVFPKDEPITLPESSSRLSSDGEDDEDSREMPDYPYLPYHPRPAAVNSFGGWRHGQGCYMFNRKQDLLRAAFMAVVDKHLQPPPHKKLCVESKLPQGSQIATNKEDPYEFSVGENGSIARNHHAALLAQQQNRTAGVIPTTRPVVSSPQPPRTVPTSQSNRPPSKAKSKSPSVSSRPVKPKDSAASAPGSGSAIRSPPVPNRQSPNTAKRRRSSSGGAGATVFSSAQAASVAVSPLSITVPTTNITNVTNINLNLSSTTLGNININTNKPCQSLKDVNIVVTSIEPTLINGQIVSLTSGSLADMTQLQLNTLQDRNVAVKGSNKMTNVNANLPRQQTIKTTGAPVDTQQTTNINAIMAAIPGGTVVMDTGQQPAAMLPPGSVAMVQGNLTTTVPSAGAPISVPASQLSPSTTPSPLLRSDSGSPQVCTASPLANGIIPSPQTLTFKAFPGQLNSGGSTSVGDAGNDISLSLGPSGLIDPLFAQQQQQQQQPAVATLVAKTPGKAGSSTYPHSTTSGSTSAKRSNNSPSLKQTVGSSTPLRNPYSTSQAQRLAAAALNLNTQPGQLVSSNLAYNNQLIGAATAQLTSVQLQPKATLAKGGGISVGKLPMQPLSVTIVAPPSMTAQSQPPQTYIIQPDEHKDVMPASPSNAVS